MKTAALVLVLVALGVGSQGYSVAYLGWPRISFEATGYALVVAAGVAILSLAGAVVASAVHLRRTRRGR